MMNEIDLTGEVRLPENDRAFETASASGGTPMALLGHVMSVGGATAHLILSSDVVMALSAESDDKFLAMAGRVGSLVKIWTGRSWLFSIIRSVRRRDNDKGSMVAETVFIGECEADDLSGPANRFRRGVTHYPYPGRDVYAATEVDARGVYAHEGKANVRIGTVYPTSNVEGSLLINPLLSKHFAIVGSTGTGKSTTTALILHRICAQAPQGHIVMMDPHGEYAAAFGDTGEILNVSNLHLPYWLMNLDEHVEILVVSTGAERQQEREILAKCLQMARQKNPAARDVLRVTADSPIPYMLSDLSALLQTEMGRLDKGSDASPYLRLKHRLEEIKSDTRYGFMFSGMLIADTMRDVISRVFRIPSRGKPISVLDLSGVPSDITSVVVAVLARMTLDYAIWSRQTSPSSILLVCEEAHRYVPSERHMEGSSVGRIISRIAKEGRKYGVSLGLVTQRPSDLAEGVLSQCGTIITLRLSNERDQAFVTSAMVEGGRGLLDALPALRNRECIITGEGVTAPVRIFVDELEESKRPASADPVFTDLWQCGGGEMVTIDDTIQRWRGQKRLVANAS